MPPNAAASTTPSAPRSDTDRSMPGLNDPKPRAARKTSRVLLTALALVLLAFVAVTAGLYVFLKPPPPVVVPVKAPSKLHIETDPDVARIEIDRQVIGSSPLDVNGLAAGHHTVVASAAGHLPGVKELELAEGENATVVLALKAVEPPAASADAGTANTTANAGIVKAAAVRTGKLTLSTNPSMHVSLGGRALGDTPLVEVVLPVGKHVLELTNQDKHLSRSIEVEIKPGQTTAKKLSL